MTDNWDEPAPVVAELPEIKLFGKWSTEDVQVSDISLTVRTLKREYAFVFGLFWMCDMFALVHDPFSKDYRYFNADFWVLKNNE